ncbi:hypothetical protein FHR32_007722 [Streptosporangium album]|uniref:Uncharacterized protein n=1 Tax=Streptosporangium album TaxID=47479 RepID=A0A7W7S453_9ACTN|nr:hypothetical protein [Streptosporangium album]MBB4943322.1 hypothetical protein [Streptosporangium album]
MKRLMNAVTAIVLIAVTAACAPSEVEPTAADLLARPLEVPQVPPGGECPVTKIMTRPTSLAGDLLGDGPARPAIESTLPYIGDDPGTLFAGSGWGGEKVLWLTDPGLMGPLVIKGKQLDGDGPVKFDGTDGRPLLDEIVIAPDPSAKDWRDRPGYVRLKQPGCYAFQADTADATHVIVFRATGPVVS